MVTSLVVAFRASRRVGRSTDFLVVPVVVKRLESSCLDRGPGIIFPYVKMG